MGECVIMGDFNIGHMQWESLESAYSTCLGTNQRWECVRFNVVFSK